MPNFREIMTRRQTRGSDFMSKKEQSQVISRAKLAPKIENAYQKSYESVYLRYEKEKARKQAEIDYQKSRPFGERFLEKAKSFLDKTSNAGKGLRERFGQQGTASSGLVQRLSRPSTASTSVPTVSGGQRVRDMLYNDTSIPKKSLASSTNGDKVRSLWFK